MNDQSKELDPCLEYACSECPYFENGECILDAGEFEEQYSMALLTFYVRLQRSLVGWKGGKMSIFNEFGVIKHNSFFDYHMEKTADALQSALLSDGIDLSIPEIMILQRHYTMAVQNVFSTYILRRQVEKRKRERYSD